MQAHHPTRRVIFVGGTARCGSTLTDLILGNDPRGFSLGEVACWFRPTRTHHFDIHCACGVSPCPVWERLGDLDEDAFYDGLFDRLEPDFAVDSSKRLSWVIDQNRRLGRDPRWRVDDLFLYKDPISLFWSDYKRGRTDPAVVAGYYRYYEIALDARLPFVTVDHDWLVGDPRGSVRRICAHLDLPWFEDKHEFWRGEHHHLWGSFGPRQQVAAGEGSIHHERPSEEFLARREEFERFFARDQRLQGILAELRRRDLRERPDGARADGEATDVALPAPADVRRPLAYWRIRLREAYRRRFPEPHPDREASLVRERRT